MSPEGRKYVVSASAVTGRSPSTIERGKWKGTSDGMVTPSDIREWIERHTQG